MSHRTRELKKRKQRRDRNRETQRYHESMVLRTKRIFQYLGVLDALRRARIDFDDLCRSHRSPRIRVVPSPELSASSYTDGIVRALQRVVDNVTCDLPDGYSCSLQQIVTLLWPILDATFHTSNDEEDVRRIKRAIRLSPVGQMLRSPECQDAIGTALWQALREVLVKYSRIDSTIFFLEFQNQTDVAGRCHLTFILRRQEAHVERVIIDGKARAGFWCGLPFRPGNVEWITWKGEILHMADPKREYPVLVQRHALERLFGSNGRLGFLGEHEALLYRSLWVSLRQPVFFASGREDGSVLVEYRVGSRKLGYLAVRGVSDKVVVLTFLFLTMDGTPEGRELRRQLGLSRDDKAFLGLDNLDTFALTDIRTDPHLRRVLETCGCGHLCEVVDDGLSVKGGYAEPMKEYLKLDELLELADIGSTRLSELRLWGIPVPVRASSDGPTS